MKYLINSNTHKYLSMEKYIKYQRIIFKKNNYNRITEQTIQQLCQANHQGIIKLQCRKWRNLVINNIIQEIQSWQVIHLNLQENQQKNILMQIQGIKFPYLKFLELKLNRIQNLQPLTQLYAPNLQIICLEANQFSKLKNLRKCFFPNIRQLKIAANKLNDLQTLCQAQWPHLERIYLQWFYGVNIGDNIKFIAKIQSHCLSELWIQNPRTIVKLEVLKSLYRKYPNIRYQSFITNINSTIRKQVNKN